MGTGLLLQNKTEFQPIPVEINFYGKDATQKRETHPPHHQTTPPEKKSRDPSDPYLPQINLKFACNTLLPASIVLNVLPCITHTRELHKP